MKQTISLYILTCCFAFIACVQADTDQNWYNVAAESTSDILFNSVEIDTLVLEDVSSSLEGKIFINNNELHFFDYRFGWLYTFDENGNMINRELGIGNGPSELPAGNIAFHTQTKDNGHIFIGTSFDFYTFDTQLERTYTGRINWKQDRPLDYLASNPTPEDQRSYDLAYGVTEIKSYGETVYLPLMGAFPGDSEFNFSTDLFAEEARILALMNKKTGEVTEITGRYPPEFRNNSASRSFPLFFFDISGEDELTFTFATDSLIHVFTKDFEHKSSYGFAGRQMNKNYEIIPANLAHNALGEWMMDQMEEKDIYTSVVYIEETGLVFRSYVLNASDTYDGMQIYRDNVLIGDVFVPKGMRIAGYKAPWYYGNMIPDYTELQKTVHRFQLDFN
ncbi:MAG: hypothetical protein LAT80_15300 [Balneolaceae bacterium]|nr:hypothetical protein [Balneolaceae bacterium]